MTDVQNHLQTGMIELAADVRSFVLAGNAIFTLVSKSTDARYTYRVRTTPVGGDGRPQVVTHWVHVLTQPDNENGYTYLGNIYRGEDYALGKKSQIDRDALSARAFKWFFDRVMVKGQDPADATLECWHSGRCGSCGRKLTVPESIARGIGPECHAKQNGAS